MKDITENNEDTMLRQVYDTLKKDSRNGDFVALVESEKRHYKLTSQMFQNIAGKSTCQKKQKMQHLCI